LFSLVIFLPEVMRIEVCSQQLVAIEVPLALEATDLGPFHQREEPVAASTLQAVPSAERG